MKPKTVDGTVGRSNLVGNWWYMDAVNCRGWCLEHTDPTLGALDRIKEARLIEAYLKGQD